MTDTLKDFGKRVVAVTATHHGQEAVVIIVRDSESNFSTGKIMFRSNWNGPVGFKYIAILGD